MSKYQSLIKDYIKKYGKIIHDIEKRKELLELLENIENEKIQRKPSFKKDLNKLQIQYRELQQIEKARKQIKKIWTNGDLIIFLTGKYKRKWVKNRFSKS